MQDLAKEPKPISSVICSQCGNKITDPNLARCPRCYKPLLQMGACGGACSKCGEKGKREECW